MSWPKAEIENLPLGSLGLRWLKVETGYWGIPGGQHSRSTMVHLRNRENGRPVCGSIPGKKQEFQWCAAGINWMYLECRKCEKMNRNRLKGALA